MKKKLDRMAHNNFIEGTLPPIPVTLQKLSVQSNDFNSVLTSIFPSSLTDWFVILVFVAGL
jgi:hypothetical protein